MQKFQSYVMKLNYGNMDFSGDKGKNNGLTNGLSSSLEISSIEQISFLEKLLNNTLPVSRNAQEMTNRTSKLEIQHGWFIGWIEKGNEIIIFSNHIADDKKQETFASWRAKADAKERLIKIINNSSR